MLKSRPEDMPPSAGERPRKKLSFREPEIMGYYMQMKGVASRLSRRGKKSKSEEPAPSSSTPSTSSSTTPNVLALPEEINKERINQSDEDDAELEVSFSFYTFLFNFCANFLVAVSIC